MKRLDYANVKRADIDQLIEDQASFELIGLSGKMKDAVSMVETAIESKGMRCRVYTYGRIAAAGGSFFGGITGLVGIGSAVGIAAHNIATLNPDYTIAKHLVDNMLTVKYKKE